MSSLYGLNELGYRRATMVVTKRSEGANRSKSQKDPLSADCSLQLGSMKVESLVIVEQYATVNPSTGLVHTARHAEGIGLASIDRLIWCSLSAPPFFLVGEEVVLTTGIKAFEKVGSRTAVKS